MQQTIFYILTNKKVRSSRPIEKALNKEFTAGVPWFSKAEAALPDARAKKAANN